MIVSTPYHGYLKNLVMAIAGKIDNHFTVLWDGGHIKFWSRKTLTLLFEELGFTVVEFRGSGRLRSGAPKFIFVGIPVYHKGFDVLTASYNRLLVEYPDAELHVVGDADLAVGQLSTKAIRFHGKLSHAELSKLLTQMDCLVLPSRLESFGMVVVEALAAGVPVIVSDHAGASEAIQENENGWVVPAGNEDALLQRMQACCDNIQDVRQMQAACADSARAYDWSHYSRRSLDIFSSLLGSGIGGRQ